MKKLILLFCGLMIPALSNAQGTLVFQNNSPTLVQIQFWPDAPFPATTAYDAHVELYWAPLGTTDYNLFQLATTPVTVGVPLAGAFAGGTRTINGIAPGDVVSCYIRGWFGGPTWEAAVWGNYSSIFTVDIGNPFSAPLEPPGNITSTTTPFTGLIIFIPEPSSATLLLVGGALVRFWRSVS